MCTYIIMYLIYLLVGELEVQFPRSFFEFIFVQHAASIFVF